MDWADEIANGFCSAGLMDAGQVLASDKSPEHYAAATNLRRDREASERKQLASALRAAELRGRVRGMEEAVELLEEAERNLDKTKPGYLPNLGLLGNLKIIFGWKIDKLQSPT